MSKMHGETTGEPRTELGYIFARLTLGLVSQKNARKGGPVPIINDVVAHFLAPKRQRNAQGGGDERHAHIVPEVRMKRP